MFDTIPRRRLFSLAATGTLSGWLGRLAAHAAERPAPKSCILLWMSGGPSHLDTFDPKPMAPLEYRGPFGAIGTRVPGIQLPEHLPLLAQQMDKFSIVRSVTSPEG